MVRNLLKSLLKETAYPEPTENVSLIETHVSFIFITDRFVYKVKKPVDYGFLNFSTLERRHFYCEEEVRLNRRLCPDIYLGVVELYETPEGASFTQGGKVLDYAVKMRRLPDERMLDQLLARGEVTTEEMAELGRYVAAFHARAARTPAIDACGSPESIRGNWEENFRQATPFLDETIPQRDLKLIRDWAEEFLDRNADLFRARVEGGFIRECDGDLHLGNICLADTICIFDCIEFNEKFRFTDTAADIAFLLMDLEYAGRPELSTPFLAAYQETTGDSIPPPLLDFYKGYRAFIRGKVHSFKLHEPDFPAERLAEAKSTAIRYFTLARGYALRHRLAPTLILTCGLMGSGKSSLARELGFQLGLGVERSDAVRKSLPAAPAGGNREYDEGIYAESFNRATYDALLKKAREALSAGKGIIIDATFRRRGERDRFRRLARELAVPFLIMETRCPETLIRERLEKRTLDPTELSDGRWEIFHRHASEFESLGEGEAITVDSALPVAAEVDQALQAMGLLS